MTIPVITSAIDADNEEARPRRVSNTANLFLIPAGAMSVLLIGLPLLGLLVTSLFEFNLTQMAMYRFVWLSNYVTIVQDPAFWHALRVTIAFVIESVALQIVAGVAIALLFDHRLPGLSLIRTLFLAPMMIAPVFAGMIWRLFLSDDFGLAKYLLQLAGWSEPPLWLSDPAFAIHAVVIIVSWQWIPFVVLFCLAGLQIIPRDLYEAAKLDGAGPIRRFTAITLPLLMPIISTVLVFRVIDALKVFDVIYATTGGGPGDSTETLSYLVYQQGMGFFNMGYGAALATVMLIVVATLALILIKFNERIAKGRA
ncbi:carbohydrate ABC transporter permease [Neorhizobium sp. AL 9.2.2]|uniref:carbohydrate ABC transporter permease n=1 Tax=Neorhizobium sp. AL 9.2.2 TaxID=2712894 RepID=UPI0015720855|nr:sugar ABC transporter permease [Neorhizobium sp. AL 9.2.2]NSY20006.1 sugar ABC transporter permease [Neorhizobium sp. AL 9.2.2]